MLIYLGFLLTNWSSLRNFCIISIGVSRVNFKALYMISKLKRSVLRCNEKLVPATCFIHLEIMLKGTPFRKNGFHFRILLAYHENDDFWPSNIFTRLNSNFTFTMRVYFSYLQSNRFKSRVSFFIFKMFVQALIFAGGCLMLSVWVIIY